MDRSLILLRSNNIILSLSIILGSDFGYRNWELELRHAAQCKCAMCVHVISVCECVCVCVTKRESCRGCILSMGVTIETLRAEKWGGGGQGG